MIPIIEQIRMQFAPSGCGGGSCGYTYEQTFGSCGYSGCGVRVSNCGGGCGYSGCGYSPRRGSGSCGYPMRCG